MIILRERIFQILLKYLSPEKEIKKETLFSIAEEIILEAQTIPEAVYMALVFAGYYEETRETFSQDKEEIKAFLDELFTHPEETIKRIRKIALEICQQLYKI